jgi:hypothetical protein
MAVRDLAADGGSPLTEPVRTAPERAGVSAALRMGSAEAADDAGLLSPADVLSLQRSAGNDAVGRLLQRAERQYASARIVQRSPRRGSGRRRCPFSPAETAMLLGHFDHAKDWVDGAHRKLKEWATGTGSPEVDRAVARALRDNFHTRERRHAQELVGYFASLRDSFAVTPSFRCSYPCVPGDVMFVTGQVEGLYGPTIGVCHHWFDLAYFRRVTTIVHERAHQALFAPDDVYESTGAYGGLTFEQARVNADSYAVAARQIYHLGDRGPGRPS